MFERDPLEDVVLRSDAVAAGDLRVTRMRGREALSEPFEFDVVVEARAETGLDPEQVEDLLQRPARLAFGEGEEHPVHGMIRRVEMLPDAALGRVLYRLTLVPRLWRLGLTVGTWVHQNLTVPGIVRDVLRSAGLVEGDDFELALDGQYPEREYTVQYQESDLAFVSRLLEHEGITYFFAHDGDRDRLVIADQNARFRPCAGRETVPFDPRAGVEGGREVIATAGRAREVGPRAVAVRDYNWRAPSTRLAAGFVFDADGQGSRTEYGAHAADVDEARRYARLRAEELFARRERFAFTGSVKGLRAGHRFALTDHFIADLDADYVVTAIEHAVVQEHFGDAASENARYANRFEAIRHAVQFRPERKTPRPRIAGFVHARTDGPDGRVGPDGSTPIDGDGRYKVMLLADQQRTASPGSSRWIRRAQPASGDGYGVHLPLHVGAEVMLVHVDGDPDRPVIVGALPNPESASPVTSDDATTSRIKTRSGIVMGWNDKR